MPSGTVLIAKFARKIGWCFRSVTRYKKSRKRLEVFEMRMRSERIIYIYHSFETCPLPMRACRTAAAAAAGEGMRGAERRRRGGWRRWACIDAHCWGWHDLEKGRRKNVTCTMNMERFTMSILFFKDRTSSWHQCTFVKINTKTKTKLFQKAKEFAYEILSS